MRTLRAFAADPADPLLAFLEVMEHSRPTGRTMSGVSFWALVHCWRVSSARVKH